MRSVDNLIVGWLDSSIGFLLRNDADVLERFSWVLVTSIDSSKEMTDMITAKRMVERCDGCSFLDTALILPGANLARIAREYNLFNGFDEVWCFEEVPPSTKPADLWIVAPLNLNQEDAPRALGQWMRASGCTLALGDGIGLNYVTQDESIARDLERRVDEIQEPRWP